MANFVTSMVTKYIEKNFEDAKYDFTNKVMRHEGKYYSYLVTTFVGTKCLVPIDRPIFGQVTIDNTKMLSINDLIIKNLPKMEGLNIVPELLGKDTLNYTITTNGVFIDNKLSVFRCNKSDTEKALSNARIEKLRDSESLSKILASEKEAIETAIKKAVLDSIENPFTKWWMEKDAEEDLNNEDLKIERGTFGL